MSDLTANKRLVEDMVAAINNRDLDALDTVIAHNVRRHCQATPDLVVECLEDFKNLLRADFTQVPDSRVTIRQILAEDDLVSVWATYEGTQEGAFGPFPPSGRRMELDFGGHLRIENGRIAEMWVTWDNLTALVQLGHLDPASMEPATTSPLSPPR